MRCPHIQENIEYFFLTVQLRLQLALQRDIG
jgi:hypothetical protein